MPLFLSFSKLAALESAIPTAPADNMAQPPPAAPPTALVTPNTSSPRFPADLDEIGSILVDSPYINGQHRQNPSNTPSLQNPVETHLLLPAETHCIQGTASSRTGTRGTVSTDWKYRMIPVNGLGNLSSW